MRTKIVLLSGVFAVGLFANAKECIEKKRFVPVKGDMGIYNRMHPSGNFVMSTIDDRVVIYDLRKNPAKRIETPMNDETYPVEGSWDLIASPNHADLGMKYFSFDEVLRDGKGARAKFNDPEHNQYYHSAAEFADSTKEKRKFRTALYSKLKYRDYAVTPTSRGAPKVEKSAIYSLCAKIIGGKEKPIDGSSDETLRAKAKAVEEARQKLMDDNLNYDVETRNVNNRARREDARRIANASLTNLRARKSEYAEFQRRLGLAETTSDDFSQPILSKDGQFIAAVTWEPGDPNGTRQTLQVFKIDGEKCTRVADAGYATSKPSFAYPEKNGAQKLTFTAENLEPRLQSREVEPSGLDRAALHNRVIAIWQSTIAFVFDTVTGKTLRISEPGEDPQYPGYTRDGRVIYSGRKDGSAGFFIVDPNQVEGSSGNCLGKDDVARALRENGTPAIAR